MKLKELILNNIDTIKALRKELHDNAELSYKEYKTQEIITNFLEGIGIPTEQAAVTGVVATLNQGSQCIAVRADMDALPVNGVSHVCGHDYHMAITCGTAFILKKLGYDKAVKFIFQPAEEAEGGADFMIKEGVLENPQVTNMIGFHVWPNVKVGTIEAAPGPSMGSVDEFKITFKGKGGHAAMPHQCKNPMYPAMDFIKAINEKSRMDINPLDSHVINFSSIQCGNAPNVIADECTILGTVRTFNNALRNKIYEMLLQVAGLSAERYGCKAIVKYSFQYPPLVNDRAYTNTFIDITKKLLGEDKVIPLEKTFAAEDFAFFAEKVPSVHFRLGIADEEIGIQPLHSACFNAHEDAIFYGIYVMVNFILSTADR